MDNNELNSIADKIWNELNSINNEDKSKEEQIEMIKSILIPIMSEQRQLGRTQILNYMEDQINGLKR